MWFLALTSFVLSGVLLGLSAFPGVLEQVPFGPWIGGALALVAAALALRHLLRSGRPRRWGLPTVVLVCAAVTPYLLLTDVPRRALFGRYRGEFEKLLATAPPPGDRAVVGLNADFDVYWVDQWGTDARGGTYFRTLVGGGPAGASFGFAYRPNPHGSPFGDADYRVRHLTGDWYSFQAAE